MYSAHPAFYIKETGNIVENTTSQIPSDRHETDEFTQAPEASYKKRWDIHDLSSNYLG